MSSDGGKEAVFDTIVYDVSEFIHHYYSFFFSFHRLRCVRRYEEILACGCIFCGREGGRNIEILNDFFHVEEKARIFENI